ncbi:DddA-like double-stranded DNA deaminase toxin [Streptomyces sp. NPDC018000]|uniref:DddA-like double-stranded DNA deaminase toxin n=1 Tax=Streptomyces sp. NPDC018000 TaxID=3365028 RepID=UPI0037B6143A
MLYLGGTEVRLTTKGTTKTLSGTRYYTAADKTIAVRTATSGVSGTKLNFLCSDPHGTASLVLEPTTWAVTKRYTTPFGSTRGATPTTWPDDKGFLGKPADTTTGLTHIGAREYDPTIGQFISVDPVLALEQHQSLNGYAYANNTPVTSADPTGLWIDDGTGHSEPRRDGGPAPAPSPTPGKTGGTHDSGSGTAGGGGSDDSGKNCGFWSKCGWSNAWEDTKDWAQDHKEIVVVATEIVTGGACYLSSIGSAPATGGASLAVTAGCGAIAGAAGAAVNNALSEDADRSTADEVSDMIDGALWGAASAVVTTAIAGKILEKVMGPCHSFLPGTGVLLADGSNKAIEDVEVGDTVTTTDTTTGKSVKKKVISTITTEDDKEFTEVTIAIGDTLSSIVATDTHPFWVPELKQWIRAGDLQVGQWLRTSAGTHVQITALSHYTKRQRTHDLTIRDIHAYYVLAGATPVLVHNCNPLDGIADDLAGSKITTGQVVDDAGNRVGPPVSSGENGSFAHVRDALRESGVPHDAAGRFAAASHVETKIALAMRSNSIQRAKVVINNPDGVCSGPYSCMTGVSAILPRGSSLTSVWRTEEGWHGVTMLGGG